MEFDMVLPFTGYIACFAGDINTQLDFQRPCRFKVIDSGQLYIRVEPLDEYSQSVCLEKFCEFVYIPVSVVVTQLLLQVLSEIKSKLEA